ncbi:hypothetical protein EO087_08045 [Dyella sp. M7H15-1]|uniref:hypothetical protein n=1 Tax=Dyella sp. M7H15-1 TaxID=2501295 RepID=UPI001004F31B|nr:hypothetical protein [Dyella sp. M7H15-1]QAU23947.1 hypothetical protein EO087_08045 [Dyella sp. M7H15-1]
MEPKITSTYCRPSLQTDRTDELFGTKHQKIKAVGTYVESLCHDADSAISYSLSKSTKGSKARPSEAVSVALDKYNHAANEVTNSIFRGHVRPPMKFDRLGISITESSRNLKDLNESLIALSEAVKRDIAPSNLAIAHQVLKNALKATALQVIAATALCRGSNNESFNPSDLASKNYSTVIDEANHASREFKATVEANNASKTIDVSGWDSALTELTGSINAINDSINDDIEKLEKRRQEENLKLPVNKVPKNSIFEISAPEQEFKKFTHHDEL